MLTKQEVMKEVTMRTFTVYHHPVRGYEAVKKGFSWPGFFFTWVWAFVKRLVVIRLLLLIAWFVVTGLRVSSEPGLVILGGVIAVAVSLLVGVQGNKWREKSLASRGYQPVATFQAASPDAAITKVAENTKLEAMVNAAVKDALEHKPAETRSRGSQEVA